ncbi:hypothetical protein EJ05DRAFT_321579 [Pseudovirgaria hyperparasitica]|uniref:Uncharacterized protein n=1 Tax=Pseudovirgaria hyperparasitica TaxID=470096 RepID=A0A6A6VRF3_9PEZI|nr:uncharacterized protein EJ05DRAFT_321579 [Pseudovirgaria hyperparasitica]KAF2752479.1 hypothetical protein EJ05DRAFT_321579 [Pseudovirgaria hyperparasitica]
MARWVYEESNLTVSQQLLSKELSERGWDRKLLKRISSARSETAPTPYQQTLTCSWMMDGGVEQEHRKDRLRPYLLPALEVKPRACEDNHYG